MLRQFYWKKGKDMKNKLRNLILISFILILGIVISHFFLPQGNILLIENEFLITFVGVILGISATIITFIFSSTEKVWNIIDDTYSDKEKSQQIQKKFKLGYQELVEDSNFIFIIFVLVITCVIVSYIDIPKISFPSGLPKKQVLQDIKMGLFLNCIVATGDLFFSLANILKLVLYEKHI